MISGAFHGVSSMNAMQSVFHVDDKRSLCFGEEGEATILLNQNYIDAIDLFPNVTRRV